MFVAMKYGQVTDEQTRQTYTAGFGIPLSDTRSLTLNGVMGKCEEEGAYTSVVTGVADDGTWYGVGSYLTYEYDSTKSVTVRYEYLQDPGGSRLGFTSTDANTWAEVDDDAVLESFTVTPQLLVGDYGTLRAEYRLDMANHPVFQVMGGAAGDQAQNKSQETGALKYIEAL